MQNHSYHVSGSGVSVLNKLEKLEQEAFEEAVSIYDYDLGEDNLKGLYMKGNIALSDKIDTTAEKCCVLAEEMGHHHTSVGNILNLSEDGNRKQERQARLWAYNRQIGLDGLIRAYENHCHSLHETAEFLEVTEEFLEEAIHCYCEKYGTGIQAGDYYVMFIPHMSIGEIFSVTKNETEQG